MGVKAKSKERSVGVRKRKIGLWRQGVSKVTRDVFQHFKSVEGVKREMRKEVLRVSKEEIKEEGESSRDVV